MHINRSIIDYNYLGLFTDLYQLKMAQSYLREEMQMQATFQLFARSSNNDRSYLVSAGLETLLDHLERFKFSPDSIEYLASTSVFSDDFLHYLSNFRFTGNIRAIPEGRIYFFNEPILEVTAPIIESQIIETIVINQINISSLIATKAARCVWAANGKPIMDFSARRTHGIDAGNIASRSTYIAGFQSTSNVLAGRFYNIPINGTMSHSYVTSFENEIDSFRAFSNSFPDDSVILVDTYDPIEATKKVITVAHEMESSGSRLIGIRIDSGDILLLSREIRSMLDNSNLHYVKILASGGLDEYSIQMLIKNGAPIDGFGVGTKVGVSYDIPSLDIAYKMVTYGKRPVFKTSPGKETIPYKKQIHRILDKAGLFEQDLITLEHEQPVGVETEALLETYIKDGKLQKQLPSLNQIRDTFKQDFYRLNEKYKELDTKDAYPVNLSEKLNAMYNQDKKTGLSN